MSKEYVRRRLEQIRAEQGLSPKKQDDVPTSLDRAEISVNDRAELASAQIGEPQIRVPTGRVLKNARQGTAELIGKGAWSRNRSMIDDWQRRQQEIVATQNPTGKSARLAAKLMESDTLLNGALEREKRASAKQAAASKKWRADNPERWTSIRNAGNARRYADERRQTPPWADMKAIRAIYREARRLTVETGVPHHVDHIVPLRGRAVSGLHVHYNLEVIPADQNQAKRNLFPSK